MKASYGTQEVAALHRKQNPTNEIDADPIGSKYTETSFALMKCMMDGWLYMMNQLHRCQTTVELKQVYAHSFTKW